MFWAYKNPLPQRAAGRKYTSAHYAITSEPQEYVPAGSFQPSTKT